MILNPIIKFFKKKRNFNDQFWYPRLEQDNFTKINKKINKEKFNLIHKSELCEIKHDGSKNNENFNRK